MVKASSFASNLHIQVFIALILGIITGLIFGEQLSFLQYANTIFMRLFKMIVIPIVFTSVTIGMMNLGSVGQLGSLGIRALTYYLSTTLLAVLLGLAVVNVIEPGVSKTVNSLKLLEISELPKSVQESNVSIQGLIDIIIPENLFSAILSGNILSIVFFALLFGFGMLKVEKKQTSTLVDILKQLNEVMLQLAHWLVSLAPFFVFSITSFVVGKSGFIPLQSLAYYVLSVIVGLSIHMFVVLPIIVKVLGKTSPFTLIKNMIPALATAFSTNSSIASLPVTMTCLEKNAGAPRSISSFVAPIGATINMDGTALYEAVAVIFLAQIYGIPLSFSQQCIIAFVATLASIGAAGIPSSGLVAIAIVLKTIGIPIDGIVLLLAVDRILDMCRTTVNVFGDACGVIVLSRIKR